MADEQMGQGQEAGAQAAPQAAPRTGFFRAEVNSAQQVIEIIDAAMAAARPNATLSTPVVQGDHTAIVVSELSGGCGAGFGTGDGENGGGTGGGGGGGAFSRPVGVVSVTAEGVAYQPIVDVTKLGIALFTTLGAMFVTWRAVRRSV